MHLRGPVNVSQLAVYQVPSEAFKLRKRSTVPFYNRRRVLKQRDHHDNVNDIRPLDKQTWVATDCSSVSTTTSTVNVTSCASTLSSASTTLPNTTYVGPPLPCLPTLKATKTTISAQITPIASPPSSNYTCEAPLVVTQNLERHPSRALISVPAQSPSPRSDDAYLRKRAAAWDRVAYYSSSAPAEATGFSFLANLGDPQQSGTFD